MRFHTATHLLCAIVPHQINGCSITAQYARLDFDMVEPLEREALERELARLVAEAHDVRTAGSPTPSWMPSPSSCAPCRCKPPRGLGACACWRSRAWTCSPAAARTWPTRAEIGALGVAKIEKKSARTRRVVLEFLEG